MRCKLTMTLAMAALVTLVFAQERKETPQVLFGAAVHQQEAEGNFKEAIRLYEAVLKSYGPDRKLAAVALMRMAECYRKLGSAEARKALERLVRDFADQKDTAAEARLRLAAMSGGGQPGQRLVWSGPKVYSGEISLSPDGRFACFPDWDSGNLGLHDLASGADRLLTKSGNWKRGEQAFAEECAVSRDGKQVAYSWYEEKLDTYQLYVVNVTGDPMPLRLYETTAFEYLEPLDWSPDGRWIIVWLRAMRPRDKTSKRIGLVSTQDGSLRVLKSGPENEGLYGGRFSPDGKHILYTRQKRGYVLSVDRKSEVPLLSGPSSVEAPVWTPDGLRVVFGSDRSGSTGLWSVRVAEGKPLGEPGQLKADFRNAHAIGFTRDGSLFYDVTLRQSDIYVAGLEAASGKLTSEPERVNQRSIGNSEGRVAWLPDGKSLSFFNNRSGMRPLVVHTLATGEERDVPGVAGYPGWFLDGSLMSRQNSGGTVTFRRVNTRTGETQATWTVPALPSGASGVGFSPDLITWYFQKRDDAAPCEGANCTHVMLARDLETGRDREIFRITAVNLGSVSVSHDGRSLAFRVGTGAGYVVMVAPTAGGPPRELGRLPDDHVFITATAWTPDGGHVLALRFPNSRGEVWSIPAGGGLPEKSTLGMGVSSPAVSPAGTQVAFVGTNTLGEVWVMTGLFPDAKSTPAR